jgi:glycosyltransferase involved in cell wall biosynthesis
VAPTSAVTAFWFSLAVLAASLAFYGSAARGWRKLRRLADVAPDLAAEPPRLSIVLSALNEADGVEPALRSMAALDYPRLEIVAVDDRSTDSTGEILDRLAREFQQLQVLHVRALPAGWLGKTHALWQGALRASGDYILFTDADVVFEPSALRRAVAHCESAALDHLTVIPSFPMRTSFLRLVMLGGVIGMLAFFRPWRAAASGKTRMGVGAFNMVRAASYRQMGGHQALAMQVLDDIELGRLMSGGSLRQDALLGNGMVSVEMYRSAAAMFGGIQKNLFTFLDYSVVKLLGATFAAFALCVWPWAALLATAGASWWLNLATVAAALALHAHLAPSFGYSRWCIAWLPVYGVLSIFLYWQVAIATWLRGGIVWRGTHYPLADLKRARARPSP